MKGVLEGVLTRGLAALLIAFAGVAVSAAAAPGASAATDVPTVAAALREHPVYVDPSMTRVLSDADADALAAKIEKADKPVFVAVLPGDFPTENLFQDLRTDTGITGLYAIRLGTRFDAKA